ncbi:hypothetical protein W97_07745 [Coniosporium apollinis CBS 100218]|uniref:Uncharacterized protein n=1 Tax=Coniosporium apollinis (strain CBS 100218) TaxID=1168221 RepID=R7Z3A4_CONA1|nr:uncharacterized protein W97_07745 [Coniosporium apollinis CBS 100218]EON68421.1 hypothetical protein W97_07745 [Coniosporium apollinis CBS 100218]
MKATTTATTELEAGARSATAVQEELLDRKAVDASSQTLMDRRQKDPRDNETKLQDRIATLKAQVSDLSDWLEDSERTSKRKEAKFCANIKSLQAGLNQKNSTIRELEEEQEQLWSQQEAWYEQMECKYDAEIQELQSKHEAKIQQLQSKHEAEDERRTSEFNAEVERSALVTHERELRRVAEETTRDALSSLRINAGHAKENDTLKAEKKQLQADFEAARKTYARVRGESFRQQQSQEALIEYMIAKIDGLQAAAMDQVTSRETIEREFVKAYQLVQQKGRLVDELEEELKKQAKTHSTEMQTLDRSCWRMIQHCEQILSDHKDERRRPPLRSDETVLAKPNPRGSALAEMRLRYDEDSQRKELAVVLNQQPGIKMETSKLLPFLTGPISCSVVDLLPETVTTTQDRYQLSLSYPAPLADSEDYWNELVRTFEWVLKPIRARSIRTTSGEACSQYAQTRVDLAQQMRSTIWLDDGGEEA